jgi:hypothetical protein
MKPFAVVVAVLVVTTPFVSLAASATVDDDAAPFAEAGLDQTVTVGQTVLLDGGGSNAARGNLSQYNWTITAPNGDRFAPDCPECVQTEFLADQQGTYTVALTVTDDAGRTDRDVMYVTAGNSTTPDVTLVGPSAVLTGGTTTYTALVEPGDASLSHLSWDLDGTRVEQTPLNGTGVATLDRTFDDPGTHTLDVTVHDDAGRERSDSATVRVRPSGGSSPTDSQPSLSVLGDETLSGEPPFESRYRVGGEDADDVQSVSWYDETGRIGSGEEISIEWDPGTHRLYAVATVDDASHLITFESGDKEVTVDPRPSLSLQASQDDATLTGSVSAGDEFGNLDSVRLFVDGDPVREWTPDDGTAFDRSFSMDLPPDQTESRVRAVATDERGQVTTDSNEAGEPELISSGFVNDPVDSYHPKIDSKRYTAVHEMRFQLNGADPSEVSADVFPHNIKNTSNLGGKRVYNEARDELLISTEWYGETPGKYLFTVKGSHISTNDHTLNVESSPPEVRIDVPDEGLDSHRRAHRLLIDISDTFDPDNGDLEFIPHDRDRYSEREDIIGLEFAQTPKLVIKDDFENRVELTSELYHYYTPEVQEINEVSEGPYTPDDTVRFEVVSEMYELSDPTHSPSLDLEVDGGKSETTDWNMDSSEERRGAGSDSRNNRNFEHVGTVEVKASSFVKGESPRLKAFNTNQERQSARWTPLPDVTVRDEDKLRRLNAEITDLEYVINPTKYEETATTNGERASYRNRGYSVERTDREFEWVEIEKRETERQVTTNSKSFQRESARDAFVASRMGWNAAGTSTTIKTRETKEWRDSSSGQGRYTGEVRTIAVCDGRSRGGGSVCIPPTDMHEKTQYLHKYEEEYTEYMYDAEQRIVDEVDRWSADRKSYDLPTARRLTRGRSDLRLGSRLYSTEWQMVKYVDDPTVSTSVEDPSRVQVSRATVEGEVGYLRWEGPENESTLVVDSEFSERVEFDEYRTRDELIEAARKGRTGGAPQCVDSEQRWC